MNDNISWNKVAGKPALQKLWNRVKDRSASAVPLTPDDVIAACNEFCDVFPNAEYRGGHIVLSDFNTELPHIAWCIRRCAEEMHIGSEYGGSEDGSDCDTIHFLSCLAELSDSERIAPDAERFFR